ncbi:1-acyl-sn-glycerol-3-phosphate acyltransferase [Amycolatopsis sp. NBC_00345]|uniref:lysophospholipid acyltransferase family protein n=1 Tax=Amycolatopsis sp. NBC_00345 TaxID=2975955 RepID=UPI002E258B2F
MSHAWMPTSPCGDGCLTEDGPTVAFPRRVLRFGCAISVVVAALLTAPLLLVLRGRGRELLVRTIFRAVLRSFGVKLAVHGGTDFLAAPAGRGALVVNNHISWLDIVAINALRPMRALAKVEIGGWPVLGTLVRRGGSIFLDRTRLRTLPGTMTELADALRSGSLVNVTPEGTTWCGLASGRFTTATFQAAIDGGVPVRPVALRYRLSDGRETSRPAFVGPESLIASLRRVAALRGLVLEVHVCPEIAPGRAEDRRSLAELAEASVHSALGTVRIPPQRRRLVATTGPATLRVVGSVVAPAATSVTHSTVRVAVAPAVGPDTTPTV